MKNKLLISLLLLACNKTLAGEWLVVKPSDITTIELTQSENSTGAPEALYIGIKGNIRGQASTYCTRKDFIAISDPKLLDKVYSGVLFAIASQKTMQFWLDNPGKCIANIPLTTMFMIYP